MLFLSFKSYIDFKQLYLYLQIVAGISHRPKLLLPKAIQTGISRPLRVHSIGLQTVGLV